VALHLKSLKQIIIISSSIKIALNNIADKYGLLRVNYDHYHFLYLKVSCKAHIEGTIGNEKFTLL